MGIVFPNEAIARRWNGALEARLRRAPLEAFLSARSLAPAPAGVAQDTDNLVRATVCIVGESLSLYFADRVEGLAFRQRMMVGHVVCLVSRVLADLISQPGVWRIVALVSTARLLSPWIGLNAAAMTSAASTREFQKEFMAGMSSLDRRICERALAAVNRDRAEAMADLTASIATRLSGASSAGFDCAAEDPKELYAGS